jgi:excisionase family DNA binding protein
MNAAEPVEPVVVKRADGTPITTSVVSVPVAAEYLGVSEQTLRNWLWRGVGPKSYKVGGHRKLKVTDLDAFIEAGAEEPAS